MATETVNVVATAIVNAIAAEVAARIAGDLAAIATASADATSKANAAQAAAIAASQPLDGDLTAYANAADATARRALIGAGTGNGNGDVVGPASATDNGIARYNLTTGKLIQDSGITIADGATGTLSGTNTGDQSLAGYVQDGDALTIGLQFPANGLQVADTAADHSLTLKSGEDLTAGRRLSFVVNDANRILTIPADASVSGTNTGDQDLSGLQPLDADLTAYANAADATARRALIGAGTGNGDALVANPLSQFAATTSAQLKGVISDEMAGPGTNLAFGTSGVEAAYTGTDSYTAGVAPSGAVNKRQFYTEVGNCVTWQISITYATAGTTMTNTVLTFPTEFPAPVIPTGFTGANARLYPVNLRPLSTLAGTQAGGAGAFFITRNGADTGFEISGTAFNSATVRTLHFAGSYFTS